MPAYPPTDETVMAGPWPAGINNRQPDHAVPGECLRNAVNADVDRLGFASRRTGYARAAVLTGAHSGWAGAVNGAFIVEAFSLYKLASDLTKTLLTTGVTGRMAYEEVGDTVYMSDGQRSWKYRAGVLTDWGVSGTVEDGTITSMPPGRIIRQYNGRVYVASGNAIHYSEPFAFDWYRPATNFMMLQDDVTVIEPVADGIWIVAENTYFYAGGGPEDFVVRVVSDYGATFGSSKRLANKTGVVWHSDAGPVTGGNSGEFAEVARNNFIAAPADSAAAMVRRTDGKGQFVVSLSAPASPTMAASDWLAAETTRKGV